MKTTEKLKSLLFTVCDVLELAAGCIMVVGIVLSMIGFVTEKSIYGDLLHESGAFLDFVERVFTLVIGMEFLQMLCKPNNDNVIEILIFLVARHMIVGTTTPVQDLISVVSIILLSLLRAYLHDRHRKREKEEAALEAQKAEAAAEK